jgi:hypothetical protein
MTVFGATAAMLVRIPFVDLIIVSACMAGALLVGAVVIALVGRWRKNEDKPLSTDAQLGHFRSLYERGEISAEEYQTLRAAILGLPGQRAARKPVPEGSQTATSGNVVAEEQPSLPPQSSPPPPEGIQPS